MLSRRKFQQITQLLGMQQLPMSTLREYDQNAAAARAAKSASDERFAHLQLHHLNRIATLGSGGYSRVDLVRILLMLVNPRAEMFRRCASAMILRERTH